MVKVNHVSIISERLGHTVQLNLRLLMVSEDYSIADPFRFHFEISWEVANKGEALIRTPHTCRSL